MSERMTLIDIVSQVIQSGEITLPVFNTCAIQVQKELAKKTPDVRVLEKIISSDQALSSQVLKVSNSAFYRGLSEVTTIRAAIVRFGVRELGNIVLLAATKKYFTSMDKSSAILMKKLWQHSVCSAYGALWIAKRHEYGVDQSEVFMAGLLHDVGMLLILLVVESIKMKQPHVKITDALLLEAMEKQHTALGYQLMSKWNMPEQFCIIARDHHLVDFDTKDYLLIIVRMAELACLKMGIGIEQDEELVLAATLEASLLNLTEIDIAELEIMLEDMMAANKG